MQAVTNAKATVKKTVQKKLEQNGWNPSDISENSGAVVKDVNDQIELEGNLLEIQAAWEFIKRALKNPAQERDSTGSFAESTCTDEIKSKQSTFVETHADSMNHSESWLNQTQVPTKCSLMITNDDLDLLKAVGHVKMSVYTNKTATGQVTLMGNASYIENYKTELQKLRNIPRLEIVLEFKQRNIDLDFCQQTFPGVFFHDTGSKLMLYSWDKEKLALCRKTIVENITAPVNSPKPDPRKTAKLPSSNRMYPDLTITADEHSRSRKITHKPIATRKNVHIYIRSDNIFEVTGIHCLIVPTDEHCQFKGRLATSLIQKGGERIRSECSGKKKHNMCVGDCIKTTGGELHFLSILHVVTKNWRSYINRENQAVEAIADLKKCVLNSLKKAKDSSHRSVALPAIGTGKCSRVSNIIT